MTNCSVIGPIEHSDWYTMRMLRADIEYMKSKKSADFGEAIRKEVRMYKKYIQKIISGKEV